jgi:protein-tyrosine phosphatase
MPLQQSNSKVLVHYAVGINRSVARVVAYVCHRKEINLGRALELVRRERGCESFEDIPWAD